MYIRFVDDRMILVSHMSEIHPAKEYPELSAICPNEMHYGTKFVVGNAPASIQKMWNKSISRLHADRDVCKESTDTSKEATQGCSATLKFARFCKRSGHRITQNPTTLSLGSMSGPCAHYHPKESCGFLFDGLSGS